MRAQYLILSPKDDEEDSLSVRDTLFRSGQGKLAKGQIREMDFMRANRMWELIDLSEGRKAIGNKWVLKYKQKAYRSIDKPKARLVAKGYT